MMMNVAITTAGNGKGSTMWLGSLEGEKHQGETQWQHQQARKHEEAGHASRQGKRKRVRVHVCQKSPLSEAKSG